MSTAVQAVAATFFAAALLPGLAFGQPKPNQPIKATLCELVNTPDQFNGKIVQFTAEYVSRFQWEGFVDESCSAKLQISVKDLLDALILDDLKPVQGQYAFTTIGDDNEHPERLNWKPIPTTIPVHLRKDGNYKIFRTYADAKFRWPDGGVCLDCPLHRINVTAIGRFDHFETHTVAVRASSSTKAIQFSDALETPLSRFLLESLSDVTATPIDPSVYTATGLREISMEEASNLLTAFLKSRGFRGFGLEKSGDMGYPEFYFFMAILGASKGPVGVLDVRYYAVDRKTGDVWNSGFCEQMTSRTLRRLQKLLCNRIGLTQNEYRKARRLGPLCEPGYPRAITRK